MRHKLTEKQRLQQEELQAAGKKTDVNTSSGSGQSATPESAGTVAGTPDTAVGTSGTGPGATASKGSTTR